MPLGTVRPVISPNGRHIARRADGKLWIRNLDSEVPREIPAGQAPRGDIAPTRSGELVRRVSGHHSKSGLKE